jgi:steroid delta-isomerase-like uncharacterized protein
MGSVDENKALVRRLFEQGMNEKDDGVLDAVLSPDFVNHDMPAPSPGPEGFRQMLGMFRAAFPDMNVNLEEVLGDGDKVVTRGFFSGTHKGEFMGVPASGASINVKYIDVWRIQDGKITDNWVRLDLLGLMQQVGAVPS